MSTHEADCATLVAELQHRRVSDSSAKLARTLVGAGLSRHIVETTVAGLSTTGGDRENAIEETMKRLEELAEFDPAIACILMSELWSEASDLMMHWICNGIELWLDATKSPEILAHLQHLAAAATNHNYRRRLQDMIQNQSQ